MSFKEKISQIILNKNFRHGMLYTVYSFVNSGISFILLLILAKYLTPSDYGYLNLFTTFVTLLNIFISLSTVSYITVSFFQKNRETLRQIILIALATSTGMLILLSLLMYAFPGYTEHTLGIPIHYLWMGLFICYCQVFNSLNLDIWRLEEKPLSYGVYSVSFAICNFALSFWLIVNMRYGWLGRVYAWTGLGLVYFLISVVFLIKRKYLVIKKTSWSLIKETYIYALPLIPHAASFWLKTGMDRYIINYFYNESTVGYYSFAANLGSIVSIIGLAFNSSNSVYIYKKLAEGYANVKSSLSRQTRFMTLLFLIVTLGVIMFAWGLIFFFIPAYSESLVYLVPLTLGGFFQCIYLLWVNYLFFYKKTKQLMTITISTALLQVVLSIWLTRYSALYTAYISMIVYALTMILVKCRSSKILKSKYEEGNIVRS